MIFLQITLGAFTSGLDAGNIYQTWPSMNNNFFPDDVLLVDLFSLNLFSEPSIVQFLHRNIAYLIFLYMLGMSFFYIFIKKEKYLYNALYFLITMVFVQIILGIFTLISGLNIYLASLHQISTTLLIISSINFCFSIKKE